MNAWFGLAGGRVELFFAVVFGFVGLMSLLYSVISIRGKRAIAYFVFLMVLVGSSLGAVFSQNLVLVFVFWEIATFALWRMLSFRKTEQHLAWVWWIDFVASGLILAGLLTILLKEKTANIGQFKGISVSLVPALLVLIGILAKSVGLPLHIWLSKRYKDAPAGVGALVSGIVGNIGVVLFFKLFLTVHVPNSLMTISAILALVLSIVAGGVAMRSNTMRGILTCSTISQSGFIFLGLSMLSFYGILGGITYVFAYAVANAGLFFSMGLVEDATGTGEIRRLGGGARKAPVLATATAMLGFSIIGLPPFLGFFARLGIVFGAVDEGILLGIGAILAIFLSLVDLVRLYTMVFLGDGPSNEWRPVNWFLVGIVVLMALVSLAGGFFAFLPIRFLGPGIS
ncbi:hypothetical protein CH330_00810 [candidate division WOR-3 bacterium JGI_Cruoil_03_51_56]|uniref:NADH:quinone oxidoreductase/Mrp antiporter transmembrane domain-containing protein n=1 Tax=candidate division WOR-3 bacterium JGI_Cruoil_03_51_56 TaxID=1973747 RepID=A0A235BYD1_UNCW3|nr:MAG: hypothetical protein CH330_00810 [candidate division WOR-3 bacterium JGI_Cruoil_03_51_56]